MFLFESGSPQAMALFRIVLCAAMLVSQLSIAPDVTFFYSDAGVVTNAMLSQHQPDPRWSLLHFFGDPTAVRVVHVLYIAAEWYCSLPSSWPGA